jgi:hypothetical protein
MASECPECDRSVPDDSVYCPYCGHGITPRARTSQVYAASLLLLAACTSSGIFIILSTRALLYISTWYPQLVAQTFYVHSQMLLILSLGALVSGSVSVFISYRRLNYRWAIASATACTLCAGAIWVATLLVPWYPLWSSIVYYFLPQFLPPLVGTLLLLPRNLEFEH